MNNGYDVLIEMVNAYNNNVLEDLGEAYSQLQYIVYGDIEPTDRQIELMWSMDEIDLMEWAKNGQPYIMDDDTGKPA